MTFDALGRPLAQRAGVHPKVVIDRLGYATTNITLNTYSNLVEVMWAMAAKNVAAAIFGEPLSLRGGPITR